MRVYLLQKQQKQNRTYNNVRYFEAGECCTRGKVGPSREAKQEDGRLMCIKWMMRNSFI